MNLISLTGGAAYAEPRYTLTELPTPAGNEFSVAYQLLGTDNGSHTQFWLPDP